MTVATTTQLVAYIALLLALAWPLGIYMARVFSGERVFLTPVLRPVEQAAYRALGVAPHHPQTWKGWAASVLTLSIAGIALLFLLQLVQGGLPGNPEGFGPRNWHEALNVAVSFVTNTNWQNYSGETTYSYFTQMAGLGVQNFLSAGIGIVVLIAVIRGIAARSTHNLGNFWVDLVRCQLYVLLPLASVLALVFVSQGVVQTFSPYAQVDTVVSQAPETIDSEALGGLPQEQTVPLGPAASQIAIKQLGTNGGGFFGTNSAHPMENPTALTNLLQSLAILLIPAALCVAFGRMVGNPAQGRLFLGVMVGVWVSAVVAVTTLEQGGAPALQGLDVDQSAGAEQSGGNMEGKEARFGVGHSALWAVSTTVTSNGSVNSMHNSYQPVSASILLSGMHMDGTIFGAVGGGLQNLLIYALVAVFLASLMVGRTPAFLGKPFGMSEIRLACVAILLPSCAALVGVAASLMMVDVGALMTNDGARGFTELLYTYSSAAFTNGSAFEGFSANTVWFNTTLALAMLVGRFAPILAALAIAGSLAQRDATAGSRGGLSTTTPLFGLVLALTVVTVAALTFLPAHVAGPILEAVQLHQ